MLLLSCWPIYWIIHLTTWHDQIICANGKKKMRTVCWWGGKCRDWQPATISISFLPQQIGPAPACWPDDQMTRWWPDSQMTRWPGDQIACWPDGQVTIYDVMETNTDTEVEIYWKKNPDYFAFILPSQWVLISRFVAFKACLFGYYDQVSITVIGLI